MNIKENIKTLIIKKPLKLDCGQIINDYPLAYETYGTLNENRDNAILVCHALTGDQFVTGLNPIINICPPGLSTRVTSRNSSWLSSVKSSP